MVGAQWRSEWGQSEALKSTPGKNIYSLLEKIEKMP